MYAQQPIYQTPPQWQPPQPGSAVEEISKVLDLADKLRGRESAGNFAPGMARDANLGVGSMQTRSLDQLTQQELLLSNPALHQRGSVTLNQTQVEQLRNSISTMQQGSQQLSQQLDQALGLLSGMMQAYNAMCNYADQLERFQAVSDSVMNAYNAMCEYASVLEQTTKLGYVANTYSNAFLQEKEALEQVATVQSEMLRDPVYLLNHSFSTWDANIGTNRAAMDYISELYLELAERFDLRYQRTTGTPAYPSNRTTGGVDPTYFKAFSGAMSSGNSKVGQRLQQMHSQKFGI